MSLSQGSRKLQFFPFSQHLLLVVLLAWCLPVSDAYAQEAQTQVEIAPSAVRLFELSGLQELIAQIPASTASAFEASLTADQLPERFKGVEPDLIRVAVRNAFSAETFDNYMVRQINQEMSEQSKNRMLSWYQSPLGARVKQAELDNSLLTEQSRFEAYQQRLLTSGVGSERENLVYQMDEIIHSTESAVDMMANIQIAFNISLSRFLPEDQQFSRAEIQALAQRNHTQRMTQYRNQTREVLLFTYQEFDNEELRKINKTLSTVAGQEFVAAINSGIKNGMFASALDLGDELGELIGKAFSGPGI